MSYSVQVIILQVCLLRYLHVLLNHRRVRFIMISPRKVADEDALSGNDRSDRLARTYFREWRDMKHRKGKTFIANPRILRQDVALYFPNLHGKTLATGRQSVYDTTPVLANRISVVGVYSSAWAEAQVKSFTGRKENPALWSLLDNEANKGVVQQVEVNIEENFLKAWLIKLFRFRLRRARKREDWGRYFLVRRGVTREIREATGMLNAMVGYVYLIDGACKIRWAGSGIAEGDERTYLVNALSKLVEQAKSTKKLIGKEKDTDRAQELEPDIKASTDKKYI